MPAAALSRSVRPRPPPRRGARRAGEGEGAGDQGWLLPALPAWGSPGLSGDWLLELWAGCCQPRPPSSCVSPYELHPPRPSLRPDLTGIDFLVADTRHSERLFCASYLVASLQWASLLPSPRERAVGPDASLGIYLEFCPLETHLQIQSSKALISAIAVVD